ncbi:NAD(P)-binding protein [Stipitochalara longipes BDJ]|nr:NAD(P)-binding protein [Stipitochalara longipes BDJ]
MAQTKTYLITGANRGLGRGLLEALIQRPNTIVIAGVRNLSDPTVKSLESLAPGSGSKIIPVIINSTDDSSAPKAIEVLQSQHGITKIDTVIANAGISNYYGPAATTPVSEVREHFEVNAVGTIVLFQATWPLLKLSSNPLFVALSTGIASIGDMEGLPLPSTAYGMSKVAINYMVRKIHFENPELTAFVISPGWVQTEMGNMGASAAGMEKAPVTLEESITGMLSKIDHATRESISGTFQSFDETNYNW